MAITTATVTLNAAFLQEIKEDNEELWRLLGEVRQAISDEAIQHHVSRRRLCQYLEQLRDTLAMHFALEEAFGYFDDPVAVAPRLSETAEALRSQHSGLFLEMLKLVEQSERLLHHETPSSELSRLAAAFHGFDERLRKHESAENRLVLEALDVDIGVGD